MRQEDFLISEVRYKSGNTSFDNHFHNAYEVMYITGGSIRVKIDGKEYTAGKNSLIFFGNLEEHMAVILEEPFQRYYATISILQADRMVNEPILMSLLKNRPTGFCHVADVTEIASSVTNFFESLIFETEKQEAFSNELCACYLKKFLIDLYRYQKKIFPQIDNHMNALIYEIQRYIDTNFDQPIRIEELAKAFYVDLFYLSHCFKQQTGYSPKQYLMKSRLSQAKEQLVHTENSVTEIAFKCGFSDVNNFIRTFKADTGMTPNRYRKIIDKNDVF